ncbi:MAG: flagellin [Candidatus Poribacteria bacterium]|nr:flagellin [Candidatus Poribacteria bacterium]
MFRVSSNVSALTAMRHLDRTGQTITTTTERLSSGLRINKARDDAAAMFISEQLRSQVATLRQANRNVGQATTLLQVMEGGLEQMTGILTRLKELAIQAADGAFSDQQRQRGIQVEADQLIAELDRLVAGVTFNGITLFPDNDTSLTFQVGETQTDRVNLGLTRVNKNTILDQFASKIGFINTSTNLTAAAGFNLAASGALTATTATQGALLTELKAGDLVQVGTGATARQFFVNGVTDNDTASLNMRLEGQLTVTNGSTVLQGVGTKFTNQLQANDVITMTVNGTATTFTVASVTNNTTAVLTAASGSSFTGAATITTLGAAITGQTTARADTAGQFLAVNSMQDFLNQIASGIDTVISQRARLGAIQSRLERTQQTGQMLVENTINADSVIRDADMAMEISNLVRAQILAQAGTSVLNQANLLPQNVLNLLSALQ